jgi:hypothetical protein
LPVGDGLAVGAVAIEVGVKGVAPLPHRARHVFGRAGPRHVQECGFEGVELRISVRGAPRLRDRLHMPGRERARSPLMGGLVERVDLTGDADAAVCLTAGTSRLGHEERGRGSGAVRGPLTRSVERAQSTSDFRVEAGAGSFQREQVFTDGPVPQLVGRELVDRFVQALDRRIHT